ncbi:MAG: LicD family protein [Bacteroidales bacterium]|nr:LicD family protein [Bacteroidales bacterium]
MDLENKYGTLEIQKELLALVKEVHSFCISNGVKYSIAYGSLLGAVRHKGFIPWDDDFDIMVDRENYNKILDSINGSRSLTIDRCQSSLWIDRLHRKDCDYHGPYSPTCDIFIIDTMPDNYFLAQMKIYAIYMMQGMMKVKLSIKKGGFFMKVCSLVTYIMGLPFSPSTKKKWYTSISQWFYRDGQKKRCYNACFEDIHCVFPSNVLDKIHLASFEDTEVYIIDEYDPFLRSRYGYYMTPPPQIERMPKHF